MKLFAPKYYKYFKCIADKCTHSCCVGWEIDIDDNTLEKYNSFEGEYSENIKNSIEISDTPHFILEKNERCPHLNEHGLCEIITNVGMDYLCNICREHPRFYNYTNYGKEVGLGMSCEEACRIILTSDDYNELIEIGDTKEEANACDFDAVDFRNFIYSVIRSRSIPYEEKLEELYELTATSPDILSDSQWQAIISQLEYLNESHKEMFLNYSSSVDTPKGLELYLERALAYFVYRHCSEACDKTEFFSCLGFSMLCERLLCSICREPAEVFSCARIISEELEYSQDNTERIKEEFFKKYE